MTWPRHIARKDGLPNHYYPPPLSLTSPPPPPAAKISPAVLFIIIILSVLFFISGLLHLLVRFLTKRSNSSSGDDYPEISSSDTLQRQLQQLFNLHDSGLDQAFIDALPVFFYEEILGPKEPFDCAVCLCEFSDKDKLRLLPTCSHAFHISCIDTWLLSNSTCPLCRAALFANGTQLENPIFEYDEEDEFGENGLSSVHQKMAEIRLGKFRKLDCEEEPNQPSVVDEASNSNLDARRCYSMGSYQYVVGKANLRVALCPDRNPRSKIVVRDVDQNNGVNSRDFEFEGKKISSVSRGDSYSVSKIWLWQKKGGLPSSSGDARIDLSSLGTTEFPWIQRSSNA